MSALVITDQLRREIQTVKTYAEQHIVDLASLQQKGELKEGDPCPIAGDDEKHILIVPLDYKVVYSIEDQGTGMNGKKGLGLCRHLSMSVNKRNRLPNPISVDMMIEEFGFTNPLYKCIVWSEQFGDQTQNAINVIEPINNWPDEEIATMVKEHTTKLIGQSTVEVIDGRRNQYRETLRETAVSTGT